MGEIRHIQAPLAAAVSPLAISPSAALMNEMRLDHKVVLIVNYSRIRNIVIQMAKRITSSSKYFCEKYLNKSRFF